MVYVKKTTPRICPSCRVEIPIETGFYFDSKLNMICGKCKAIAFPAVAPPITPITPITPAYRPTNYNQGGIYGHGIRNNLA